MSTHALAFALTAMRSRMPRLVLLEPPPPPDDPADWPAWRVHPGSLVAPFLRNRVRQLFDPAPLESDRSCLLDTFLAETACLAFAARVRVPERPPALSGLTLARLVAERIEGRRAGGGEPEPSNRALLGERREEVLGGPPPVLLLRETDRGLPFGLCSEPSLLLRLRAAGSRRGGPPRFALRESIPLGEPWFAPLARRALENADRPGEGSRIPDQDRRFAARLDAGEVIRGTGAHASFSVRRDREGSAVVAHALPGPFLQGIGDGWYILWERPLQVYVRLGDDDEIQAVFEYLQSLHVQAAERSDGKAGTGRASRIEMHAYVNDLSHRICMAGTFGACRRLAGDDPVHNLLYSKLAAAGRVLRHGWKRSNTSTPLHDYRLHASGGAANPNYVLLDQRQAEEYRRAHPGTELVSYAR